MSLQQPQPQKKIDLSEIIDKSENSESIRDAVSFGKNDEQSEFSFRDNVNPPKGKDQQVVVLNKSDEHSEVIPEEK